MNWQTIKIGCLAAVILVAGAIKARAEGEFSRYFRDETLRVDFYHVGNAREEFYTLDQVHATKPWAGGLNHLVDPFNNGRYYLKVFDARSGVLIYSRGFDSYFGEYRTTGPASQGIRRTYHESMVIPFPKSKIKLVIEVRDRQNALQELYSQELDPATENILRRSRNPGVKVFSPAHLRNPHQAVDIAVLAEGYTASEEGKFRKDLDRLRKTLFSQEPYRSCSNQFNVSGVFLASAESGCDEPGYGIYKRTTLGAAFDAFGLERYLLVEDNRVLQDLADHVPHEVLVILVNHQRYGGGGIYNCYCTVTADNPRFEYVFPHELGHCFGGLADEYYTSTVAYQDFYPAGLEPTEPNITAQTSASGVKWRHLLEPGIQAPTPWDKEEYDRLDVAYQKKRQAHNARIAQLKRSGNFQEALQVEAEAERFSQEHHAKMAEFLRKGQNAGKVGVFEGAGYMTQGLFRPMTSCLMFSRGELCVVCQDAIRRMVAHYTE